MVTLGLCQRKPETLWTLTTAGPAKASAFSAGTVAALSASAGGLLLLANHNQSNPKIHSPKSASKESHHGIKNQRCFSRSQRENVQAIHPRGVGGSPRIGLQIRLARRKIMFGRK